MSAIFSVFLLYILCCLVVDVSLYFLVFITSVFLLAEDEYLEWHKNF